MVRQNKKGEPASLMSASVRYIYDAAHVDSCKLAVLLLLASLCCVGFFSLLQSYVSNELQALQ